MRVVVLMGSPKKNGHTKQLTEKVLEGIDHVEYYDLYRMNLLPCIDCQACYKVPGCAIKTDEMEIIYEAVTNADVVVIASPIHFASLTGKMMVAFSRFQTFWSAQFKRKDLKDIMPKKRGFLIITSGTNWTNLTLIPEGQAQFVFDHIRAENYGFVHAGRTDTQDSRLNERAIKKGKRIIDQIKRDGGFTK